MEKFCTDCGGMVNDGSACSRSERPACCPLRKTEREHYAELATQTTPGPVSQTVEGLTAEIAKLHEEVASLKAAQAAPAQTAPAPSYE